LKSLRDILTGIPFTLIKGDLDMAINGLSLDSRKISRGMVFLAAKGSQQDGYEYISSAIERGAVAIICERTPDQRHPETGYLLIPELRSKAGMLASNFFDHPSHKLKLVGVTGTNGKTSVVTLLHQFMSKIGVKAGLLSTIHNKIGAKIIPAELTTPDAISLQEFLADMVEEGCAYAFMEVSSHAIHQHRIAGCHFSMGIFTNMSHDHLDYHKTFKEYIRVKKLFFDQLPESSFALINLDDARGKVMIQNTVAQVGSYALYTAADFKGKIMDNDSSGLHIQMNQIDLHAQLIAEFNAYNLLAVYGAVMLFGYESMQALQVISDLSPPPGRFEALQRDDSHVIAIVDYAHTPDALMHVLKTIHQIKRRNASVITVVGCGGDRDKLKRPKMAKIAVDYSDRVILTSDNPRTEDPLKILSEMETGIPEADKQKVITIANRKEAIKTASLLAKNHDMILVAGKGHETYQDIGGKKLPFDDKKVINDCFSILN
jgi:UDP-N-acetylmuramoyl-L-alanyl-D-glutamate--2,6-diaminopimelate ligase